ncbi:MULTISPECIES: hypothetical protein [unclassified Leptolyngbya]|uniref:hypothetical protein n=1 Tax=unclassified Leptolyngbya TaxID=2650499 RepID=UPI00168382C4|nr:MULTISPECIES: hypothetical protein [unclassified Leptolyngbya]MBD1909709.1 hypothetical protein [Leptolyngbya sp. FACHB-8]MBD2155975.1 hypothetical protein [Leptolyngbya sp. FACHB-16]
MISSNTERPNSNNSLEINHILETGQISRKDHQSLMTALLSDSRLNDGDRRRINQVFDALRTGKIRLV